MILSVYFLAETFRSFVFAETFWSFVSVALKLAITMFIS